MRAGSGRASSRPDTTRGSSSTPTVRTSSAERTPKIKPTRWRSWRRDQLAALLLPLGDLDKEATRAHAVRLGLPVAAKAESQDICFVEGGDYRDVLARGAPQAMTAGDIRATGGELVGRHAGIANFTVGQRRGSAGESRRRSALRHAHRPGDQHARGRSRRRARSRASSAPTS